ncbi:hypothetical protein LTR39_001224 [Cryomyces antarcticus]|nr:hypothetical protein LTR39_001224 [Cryomyces antarcticus]KAK5150990.1 hypothetical protein LTR04_006684 [Oleoguttula sp. CCFEE 6159]
MSASTAALDVRQLATQKVFEAVPRPLTTATAVSTMDLDHCHHPPNRAAVSECHLSRCMNQYLTPITNHQVHVETLTNLHGYATRTATVTHTQIITTPHWGYASIDERTSKPQSASTTPNNMIAARMLEAFPLVKRASKQDYDNAPHKRECHDEKSCLGHCRRVLARQAKVEEYLLAVFSALSAIAALGVIWVSSLGVKMRRKWVNHGVGAPPKTATPPELSEPREMEEGAARHVTFLPVKPVTIPEPVQVARDGVLVPLREGYYDELRAVPEQEVSPPVVRVIPAEATSPAVAGIEADFGEPLAREGDLTPQVVGVARRVSSTGSEIAEEVGKAMHRKATTVG